MAGKSAGSADGDAAKSGGALEKATAGVDLGASDASSSTERYVPPSEADVASGDSGGSGRSGDAPPDDTSAPDDPGAGEPDRSGDDPADGDHDSTDDDSTDDADTTDPGDEPPGDTGDGGDPGIEILPGEPPTGPPGPHRVAVDIELMIVLIAAVERAREQIPELEHELRRILTDLDLDPGEVAGFDRVTSWIDEELPGLRRRLALAQAIEDGTVVTPLPGDPVPTPRPLPKPLPAVPPGHTRPIEVEALPDRRPVTWEEDRFATCPPHEAAGNGRRAATLLGLDDDDGVAEAAELIRASAHDPYFAREFASNTDPAFIVDTIAAAEAEGSAAGLRAAVTSTIATATRATGELAVDDATRDGWTAALA